MPVTISPIKIGIIVHKIALIEVFLNAVVIFQVYCTIPHITIQTHFTWEEELFYWGQL